MALHEPIHSLRAGASRWSLGAPVQTLVLRLELGIWIIRTDQEQRTDERRKENRSGMETIGTSSRYFAMKSAS